MRSLSVITMMVIEVNPGRLSLRKVNRELPVSSIGVSFGKIIATSAIIDPSLKKTTMDINDFIHNRCLSNLNKGNVSIVS